MRLRLASGRWPCRLGAALAILAGAAGPVGARADDRFSVAVNGERLSVTARQAPLVDVLEAIAGATRVVVVLDPALKARASQVEVTAAISDVPADEAFRRLLGEWSATFLYSADGLVEVRVYGNAAGAAPSAAQRPPASAPAPLTAPQREAIRRTQLERRGQAHLLDPDRPVTDRDVAQAAETLERSLEPRALQDALDTLSNAATPPLDPLLRFAESRAAAGLRSQALELLEGHGQDPRIADLLQRLATRDPDEDIREDASRILRERGR